ncbi:hypothetical protein EC988_002093 [Linderina pennispora]|nr:hypothetical protein EC988_002093 [Linderina pennispora]
MRANDIAVAILSLVGLSAAFIDDTRNLKWSTLGSKKTRLIGHRGERAFVPEHTYASYWQAALEGADFIEPDLALTLDGQIVISHNLWLGETTNIRDIPELQKYKRNITWPDPSGHVYELTNEYFIFDMTLEDIKKVRVMQSDVEYRPQIYNGLFGLLTFDEYLGTMRELTVKLGRPFGAIPELKMPKIYNMGRPYPRYFEDRAIITLSHYGLANITGNIDKSQHSDLILSPVAPLPAGSALGPAVWQCFDQDTAAYLANNTDVPVAALDDVTPAFFTPKGLDAVAKYAKIVAPWKDFFVTGAEASLKAKGVTWNATEIAAMGGFIAPDQLVKEIHSRGMEVCPWTFYNSKESLSYLCQEKGIKPASRSGFCPKDKTEEFFYFFEQGADYMFVEDIVEANILRTFFANKLENKQNQRLDS